MTCPACGADLIPGITSCVSCGAYPEETGAHVEPMGMEIHGPPPLDPATIARWDEARARGLELQQRLTEARALEYATDITTALERYEGMVAERMPYSVPYRRLVVLYRRAKRHADEERVVRSALAVLPQGAGAWFVVRLAKILSEQRKRG